MQLSERQRHCLQGIGIIPWVERNSQSDALATTPAQAFDTEHSSIMAEIETPPPAPALSETPAAPPATITTQTFKLDDWASIEQSIEACHNCALAESCTRKVPGKGNREADLMIIGEAPGHEEDLQGKPFVGRAGQLLDRMLEAINIDPQQVYITNILKCRPPQNRDPRAEEVAACDAFLQAQIRQVQPRVILSVGRISAQNLLQDQSPVGRLRSANHRLPGSDLPLHVTYHPAYLLRNPAEKAKVWQDLKALRRALDHAND